MKITAALAFIATVSQGLLVIAAPSKGKTGASLPFKIPEKVNFDKYYKAIMKANNLTAADFAPTRAAAEAARGDMSARAAGHSPTTIYCVGVARNPLRIQIFADVHGCSVRGWDTAYSFISYSDKSAISSKSWWVCPGRTYGNWIGFADNCIFDNPIYVGYATNRDTGHQSTVLADSQGYTYMQPWDVADFTDGGRKYTKKGTIRHAGVYLVPKQSEIDYMTQHVQDHPHLYKRGSEYNTFTPDVGDAAQTFIDNLRDLTTRRNQGQTNIAPGGGFSVDLRACGLQHYAGRLTATQNVAYRDSDGTYRHVINLYFQADNGMWQWMGGITVPTDHYIPAGLIRSAFTEALRDHTTVRVDVSNHGNWVMLPLPPHVNGPLPPIPPIYGSGFIR